MHASDVDIYGFGFYTITAVTPRGRQFLRRVDGCTLDYTAYSDDTRLTLEIADAAIARGLRVTVNARQYLGSNRVA